MRIAEGDVARLGRLPDAGPRVAPRQLPPGRHAARRRRRGRADARRAYVLPVSPPPDVDVEAWHATIGEIERAHPSGSR